MRLALSALALAAIALAPATPTEPDVAAASAVAGVAAGNLTVEVPSYLGGSRDDLPERLDAHRRVTATVDVWPRGRPPLRRPCCGPDTDAARPRTPARGLLFV